MFTKTISMNLKETKNNYAFWTIYPAAATFYFVKQFYNIDIISKNNERKHVHDLDLRLRIINFDRQCFMCWRKQISQLQSDEQLLYKNNLSQELLAFCHGVIFQNKR